jgi:putative peptidoglycan lipid II flippase
MPNHFFNGGLLNIESRGIALPAVILAVSAVASRLLGVLRDWLLSAQFGAGADLDIYFAAFRIPDFIYNILVFGGITVAFLPLFSDYYLKDKKDAWRFANNTLNVFLGFLVILCAVLFIFTPQLVVLIAPGFSPEQLAKTAFLSRLMFLSPIIFGIASIFSGVLQYFRRFVAYSLAAVVYNAGIIAGIIFLAPTMGITGVGIGVIIGALLYLLVQIVPALKCGFCYKPVLNFKEPSLARVFGLMLPRTAGIAANQINLIAPTIIASTLATGSITVFNLSNNIYALPVGIIGVSYATAAFASFSKTYAEGRIDDLARKFSAAYRQIGYFTVPSAILIFILRREIVDVLYFHGQFSLQAAQLTAAALGVFCLGIYFAAMMPLMFRLFFALRDTATPTLTTVFSVAFNVVCNYLFVVMLGAGAVSDFFRQVFGLQAAGDISVLGLALAYGLANALQFAMLAFLLYRKDAALVRTREITVSFLKTVVAGIFMSVAVYLVIGALPRAGMLQELLTLVFISLVAGATYILATMLLKSPEIFALEKKWNKPH